MGQRGPKPGQYRMRPIPAGAPVAGKVGPAKFTPGAPDRPKHLGKAARKVWDRTAAEMAKAGTLTHADRDVLAAYCVAVADLEALSAEIDRDGLMVEAPIFERYGKQVGTTRKPHPGLRWRQDLLNKVRQLAGELGLTPASRSRATGAADDQPAPPNKVLEIRARIEATRAGATPASG